MIARISDDGSALEYAMEWSWRAPDKVAAYPPYAVILSEQDTGRYLRSDGTARAEDGWDPFCLFPITPRESPRLGWFRSVVRVARGVPAGWIAWSVHELDPATGLPRILPEFGGAVALDGGHFFHDPDRRRDTDGDPIGPPTVALQVLPPSEGPRP
jgi:hypothetical protein